VPHRLAIAEISDRLAVFDNIRDDVEFGVILEERLAIGIGARRVELTEILAEGDQLRIGEFLIVEDDDLPLAPYVLNSLDLFWPVGGVKKSAGGGRLSRFLALPPRRQAAFKKAPPHQNANLFMASGFEPDDRNVMLIEQDIARILHFVLFYSV